MEKKEIILSFKLSFFFLELVHFQELVFLPFLVPSTFPWLWEVKFADRVDFIMYKWPSHFTPEFEYSVNAYTRMLKSNFEFRILEVLIRITLY